MKTVGSHWRQKSNRVTMPGAFGSRSNSAGGPAGLYKYCIGAPWPVEEETFSGLWRLRGPSTGRMPCRVPPCAAGCWSSRTHSGRAAVAYFPQGRADSPACSGNSCPPGDNTLLKAINTTMGPTVVELPFLPLLATGGGGNCPCPTKIGPAGCTWVRGTLIYCLATFSILFYWPFF